MSESSLILGTAGHIDHGKSSLLKALTGTDPDRLAEEKRRGITIELGFAELTLPDGKTLGVVDVPGHERFIRQMVAGATGIDLVLFVIAADDGIMPQTREHMAIIDLLGISSGVIALTKIDLVDQEWLELVKGEIQDFLKDSPLKDAEIVPVSSRTGQGMDELREAIGRAVSTTEKKSDDSIMRLPVDRVFTIKGSGTVVTGTLWNGTVSPGDKVTVLPNGIEGRIRSVQVHNKDVDEAHPGQRVALNISGIEKDALPRGSFVVGKGLTRPTDTIDILFDYPGNPGDDKPFKTGSRVHICHGTTEVLGRILLMNEHPSLNKGEKDFAQVRLESPLVARSGDRFIVRSYSPVYTIGGGQVLASHPRRRTILTTDEEAFLEERLAHDDADSLVAYLRIVGYPLFSSELEEALDRTKAEIEAAATQDDVVILSIGDRKAYVERAALRSCFDTIEQSLKSFHQTNPDKVDVPISALRDRTRLKCQESIFGLLVEQLAKEGRAVISGGSVSHPASSGAAQKREEEAAKKLLDILRQSGTTPPTIAELAKTAGLDSSTTYKALGRLAEAGSAVKVGKEFYFEASAFERLKSALDAHLKEQGQASVADLRDALSTSRKYIIPLLEHFDATGVTKRDGDLRSLR